MTRRGVWKHNVTRQLYYVLGTAYESTNGPRDGKTTVVYLSMATGKMHTRDEEEFHQRVHPDKSVCTPATCLAAQLDTPCRRARNRFEFMGETVVPPGPME